MQTPTVPTPAVPDAPSRASAHGPSRAQRRSSGGTSATVSLKALAPAAAGASDAVWVPAVSAILILAVGALSLAAKRPWLFAALGPTALLIASSPGHSTTRFHAIVLGHLTGMLAAWVALLLTGAGGSATILAGAPGVARVWASAAAIALMAVVQPSLRAYHPPAAATVLLITLGIHPITWKTSLSMIGGVLVLALLGEWFQRLRLRERPRDA